MRQRRLSHKPARVRAVANVAVARHGLDGALDDEMDKVALAVFQYTDRLALVGREPLPASQDARDLPRRHTIKTMQRQG